jgi:hypothetical protein
LVAEQTQKKREILLWSAAGLAVVIGLLKCGLDVMDKLNKRQAPRPGYAPPPDVSFGNPQAPNPEQPWNYFPPPSS